MNSETDVIIDVSKNPEELQKRVAPPGIHTRVGSWWLMTGQAGEGCACHVLNYYARSGLYLLRRERDGCVVISDMMDYIHVYKGPAVLNCGLSPIGRRYSVQSTGEQL